MRINDRWTLKVLVPEHSQPSLENELFTTCSGEKLFLKIEIPIETITCVDQIPSCDVSQFN